MANQEIERRRTFAIIAHPDAGKTSLTEKLLLFGGQIQVAGAVKSNKIKKTATSDWMDIEKQRGISVTTSVMEFDYHDYKVNILDTPGHQDFAEDTYRRGEELKKFVAQAHPLGVTVIEDRYDPQEFYTAVQGLENEPERGGRCTVCYRLRMRRAAQYAKEHGFDWFTTTLSISPHKDAARINQIGQELEAEFGIRHLPSDFKKQNGYLRSLQLSEEYELYRQDYCGCEFSAKARG